MGFHEVILLILSILFNIHIFLIQNGVDKHFVSNEMRTEKLYNRLLRSFKLLLLKNFLNFFFYLIRRIFDYETDFSFHSFLFTSGSLDVFPVARLYFLSHSMVAWATMHYFPPSH